MLTKRRQTVQGRTKTLQVTATNYNKKNSQHPPLSIVTPTRHCNFSSDPCPCFVDIDQDYSIDSNMDESQILPTKSQRNVDFKIEQLKRGTLHLSFMFCWYRATYKLTQMIPMLSVIKYRKWYNLSIRWLNYRFQHERKLKITESDTRLVCC